MQHHSQNPFTSFDAIPQSDPRTTGLRYEIDLDDDLEQEIGTKSWDKAATFNGQTTSVLSSGTWIYITNSARRAFYQ